MKFSFYRTSVLVDKNGEVPGTLTTFGGILAIVSTILGGGLVAVPFAFYCAGLQIGILVSIFGSL